MSISRSADQCGGVCIAFAADIDGALEPRLDAVARGAADVGPEGHARDFEAPAVVLLEHARNEVGDRMLLEIGGKVRDANPVVPVSRLVPERLRARGMAIGDRLRGAGALPLGTVGNGKVGKRNDHGLALAHAVVHAFHDPVPVLPRADARFLQRNVPDRMRVVRLSQEYLLEVGQRLRMA